MTIEFHLTNGETVIIKDMTGNALDTLKTLSYDHGVFAGEDESGRQIAFASKQVIYVVFITGMES